MIDRSIKHGTVFDTVHNAVHNAVSDVMFGIVHHTVNIAMYDTTSGAMGNTWRLIPRITKDIIKELAK